MTEEWSPVACLPPSLLDRMTPEQRIAIWALWTDLCDQFLLAALRLAEGPEGDIQGAYRRWHAEQREEHDRTIRQMVENLARRMGKPGLK